MSTSPVNASVLEKKGDKPEHIELLLEAGVTLEKLEKLYSKKEVHCIALSRIVRELGCIGSAVINSKEGDSESNVGDGTVKSFCSLADESNNNWKEDPTKKEKNANDLALSLFLRSDSDKLKDLLTNETIMDAILSNLLDDDPDDPLLLDPLMMTPLRDPVVISSGHLLDRSTVCDKDTGELRLTTCPFSRQTLTLPLYSCIPIRNRLRIWENERMKQCIDVAKRLVENKEWNRASHVLEIAESLLQQMGGEERTNIHFAKALADLERSLIPHVIDEHNLLRIVKIYTRLIQAMEYTEDENKMQALLRSALQDCRQKMNTILFRFNNNNIVETTTEEKYEYNYNKDSSSNYYGEEILLFLECHKARQLFTNQVLTKSILNQYQRSLSTEILDLYYLDLVLAKNLFFFDSKYALDVWSCRRSILELLRIRDTQGQKKKKVTKDASNLEGGNNKDYEENDNNNNEVTIFLRKERLLGTERELMTTITSHGSKDNRNDFSDDDNNNFYTKYWPKDKMMGGGITSTAKMGLIHFGKLYHSKRLMSLVDCNPQYGCNHWIEVAFRPLQNLPGKPYHYPIFSQCDGPRNGWEIRVGTVKVLPQQESSSPSSSSIYVEAVWTTTTQSGNNRHNNKAVISRNEFINENVSIKLGAWHHIALAYHHATYTLTLYVNGEPKRLNIGHDDNDNKRVQFRPSRKRFSMLGQSSYRAKNRQLKCMVAFASARNQFPTPLALLDPTNYEDELSILDYYVQKLTKYRLESLQDCSIANSIVDTN